MMYGQNPYMLPMAQDFCRKSFPPPPGPLVETNITQNIKFNLCEREAVCITDKPSDYIITRVVGNFTTRSPCVIDISQDKQTSVTDEYSHNNELLLFKTQTKNRGFFSEVYYFPLVSIPYNCYYLEIYGYKHCVGVWSGLKCAQ